MSTLVEKSFYNKKKKTYEVREVNFNEKYWVCLKVFLDMVIFARYLFFL